MDQEAFSSACAWAAARLGQGGIGTLGEKSLHAALKYYFEPCPENHEQPLGGFVADAVGEHGVIEIQWCIPSSGKSGWHGTRRRAYPYPAPVLRGSSG